MKYIFVDNWGPLYSGPRDIPKNACGYRLPHWKREPDGMRHGFKVCVTPTDTPNQRCREHELMKLEREWDILLQGWSALSNFDDPKGPYL